MDAAKEARQEKKQRKLNKLGKKTIKSEEKEEETEGSTTEEDSNESDDTRSGTGRSTSATTKRHKGNKPIHGEPVRDMYKLMDGTALLALGSCSFVFKSCALNRFIRDALPGAPRTPSAPKYCTRMGENDARCAGGSDSRSCWWESGIARKEPKTGGTAGDDTNGRCRYWRGLGK